MRRILLALMTISWLFGANNVQAATASPGALVETTWLESNIKDPKLVILDIRLPKDKSGYLAGHIPGARFVPWDKVRSERTVGNVKLDYALPTASEIQVFASDAGINKDSLVVVASDWSTVSGMAFATRTVWTLQYYGIHAVVLDGGFTKWTKDKLPLDKNIPTIQQKTFKVTTTHPETIATAVTVEEALKSGNTVLIDARTPDFYRGEKKKDYVHALGHIPGAVNITLSSIMDQENGTLKKTADLEKVFASAGIGRDKPIIVYCDSGHFSSALWFTLTNVLGYQNVRQFDSSLHEWTQDKKRPMEMPATPPK